MSLRLFALVGRRTGYETLRRILESGRHELVGVVSFDWPGQVNDNVTCAEYKALLAPRGIPFYCREDVGAPDFITEIMELGPDVGLSVGWRRIVREPLLSVPRLGCINFHTSDLPRYRGFASTSWAILLGETHTAITAHRMVDGKADHGDIYLKRQLPITPRTDIGTLFQAIEAVLPGMVEQLLEGLDQGTIRTVPQDETLALNAYPRIPSDGWIDWGTSASAIDRLVRSVTRPYPGAFTCWGRKRVTIWKGHPMEHPPRFVGLPGHIIGPNADGGLRVLTGSGIYIAEEITVEGLPAASPAELVRGMRQRFGVTAGELFELLSTIRVPQ